MSAAARRRAYLSLHRLAGSRLPRYYREYLEQDRERRYPDTGELLAATLEHAVADVPHYRGTVSRGEIRADPFAALSRFPVLTRETIRSEGPSLLSQEGDRSRWRRNTSGGSTGEPVVLYQDADHLARTVAIREVYSTWAGGGLGIPELYVWGSSQDLERSRRSPRERFGNALLRRELLNAFRLDDEAILRILDELRDGPPRLVIAYAQAGYEVARFAARREIELPPQLGAIATAGTLYEPMREQLASTFGCEVVNRYGSRETGDMAGECRHRQGLHVLPWCCHVEVLDRDGRPVAPGEEGAIVVTGFTNRAMPLIRYDIGDRARAAEPGARCPCGRETQMLAAVTGRSVDMFLAEDGSLVDGGFFTELLFFRPWLRQFQVVQRAADDVVYRIVADAPLPAADREEIVERTRTALGPRCAVDFELLDEIPPSPSGKLRYTIRDFGSGSV